jgi:Bacteriophage tail sheath protein
MPEYLAPGVYVEEVSFRQKTIEGVSTSTTGFVGPARFGPVFGEPELLTSFTDFERIYGHVDPLEFDDGPMDNFLAHGVRAFFEEGGRRLYVSRALGGGGTAAWQPDASPAPFELRARFPGSGGNFTATFTFRLGENILAFQPADPGTVSSPPTGRAVLRGAQGFETVWAIGAGSPPGSPPGLGALYWLDRYFDDASGRFTFRLRRDDPGSPPSGALELADVSEVRVLTVGVVILPNSVLGQEESWEGLSFHPDHPRSLSQVFDPAPDNPSRYLRVPLAFDRGGLANGAEIAEAMLAQPSLRDAAATVMDNIDDPDAGDAARSFRVRLAGGTDGARPGAADYEGSEDGSGAKSGLLALEDVEDISIVAAPGSTFDLDGAYGPNAQAIIRLLISHCERMRYRVAVLDSGNGETLSEVRALRAGLDSTRAALYYPWVRVLDPLSRGGVDPVVREVYLPPSGFVAGIYARTDIDRGVHKTPANEVVRLALGFEVLINRAQQEALNPEGVNCLRFFEGRGYRVWGGRTASSDPEWKYLNVRRYFAYLERSIDKGTQWAVFEPNGEDLWANVRATVEDFLFNEFQSNHLLGSKPAEAYFVRCDRSTMTQNDLDNGRLVCLVGVAPLRPAEFVIFRIGQKTADSQ